MVLDPVKHGDYLQIVQGDIWSRGFPKYFETYYLFTIKDGNDNAKAFSQNLRELIEVKPPLISSLEKVQLDWVEVEKLKAEVDARNKAGTPLPEEKTIYPVANALIAFTFKGLGVIQKGFASKNSLKLDVVESRYTAFSQGMAADTVLMKTDPPADDWDGLFQKKETGEIHGLLKIAGSSEAMISERLTAIQGKLGYSTVISDITGTSQPANGPSRVNGCTRPGEDRGKEHFGFEDAISQPLMKGIDPNVDTTNVMETNIDILIVPKDTQNTSPTTKRPDWMRGGSFLVLRKLEQDVPGFNKAIQEISASTGMGEGLLKAKMMGRWPSGAPLAVPKFFTEDAQDAEEKKKAKLMNDFEFTQDNDICPMSAHIRKTNPRGGIDPNNHPECIRAKMIRNGIPYGHVGDPKVGLLFACYQAHIEDSFQVMQAKWCDDPNFPSPQAGIDAIIGQVPQSKRVDGRVVTNTNNLTTASKATTASSKAINFVPFITLKGGEYFFVPSISALRDNLGQVK